MTGIGSLPLFFQLCQLSSYHKPAVHPIETFQFAENKFLSK